MIAVLFFGFLVFKNFSVAANSTPLIVTLHLSLGDVKHNKVPFMDKLFKRALDVT